MRTLKEIVKHLSVENGWDAETEEELFETFEEAYPIVYQGKPDRHRWYTNYDVVYKVNDNGTDRFFEYYMMDCQSEDGDRDDCGFEIPDLDDLVEVFPKIVPTTIYVTKDKI